MNSFKFDETLQLQCSFIIHKDYQLNAETLESIVRSKIPDRKETEEFNLVYVCYFVDRKFEYPNEKSDVLYIGCTKGEKHNGVKSAAFRFVHLKDECDCKQNVTLGSYYKKGYVIGLDIFEVSNCRSVEKSWRYEFLMNYGALPIAEGAAYSKDKANFLNVSTDELIETPSQKQNSNFLNFVF